MSVITTSTLSTESMVEAYHYPVMYRQILDQLDLRHRSVVVDCTLGIGSLASKLLGDMPGDSLFVGIDRDEDSLAIARQRLSAFGQRTVFFQADYADVDEVLRQLHIETADIFIFDLGISTYQLSNPERGFSFLKEGPLDMRMDKNSFVSAYDLVNNLSEAELGNIFKKFGEERYYRKIAQTLVAARKTKPIATTLELANLVNSVIGPKYRSYKIHPATRVFQSLRIAVNRELIALGGGLEKGISLLRKGGRIGVISFHSLEDRIVKNIFREHSSNGMVKIITKKPLTPDDSELRENPASRSAKLRIAEKI